ncbi:DeoR/GlpR family DNA-binding transcription regulator [Lysinibacter cavernae]|uniref:DeoR family transcriptional regulator of aga operon n=1 Tax=Lysinibacter cavernae TaxID=1640652 RepID=A0A7X5QZU5_9MICO|nr:DeoR/GlpR family DNA-binding transcription regulator [Lysinibacter cavernae]NIH53069.1 DeoR family transcriptional regulator of aga operon [Lysinibacter cavernae]
MKKDERFSHILEAVMNNGQQRVEELVLSLGVSAATIRRDLDALAKQQMITRTHGGASRQSVDYDLPVRYRNTSRAQQKAAIGGVASQLVSKGDVIGLTGGTTTTAIVEALLARPDLMEPSPTPNLTVVTTAINIAVQFSLRPQVRVVVSGGVAHPHSYELVGPLAASVLSQITMDLSFIGVNALSPQFGAMIHDEGEAAINALMASRSTKSYIVADSQKIGHTAFANVGSTSLFTGVITDAGIENEQAVALRDAGFSVLT